jgi:hypothetical protein
LPTSVLPQTASNAIGPDGGAVPPPVPSRRPICDNWIEPYVTSTVSHAPASTARAACSTSTSNDAPPMLVSSSHCGRSPRYSDSWTEYIGMKPAVA